MSSDEVFTTIMTFSIFTKHDIMKKVPRNLYIILKMILLGLLG